MVPLPQLLVSCDANAAANGQKGHVAPHFNCYQCKGFNDTIDGTIDMCDTDSKTDDIR